jgi:hypothetical protein
MASKLCGEATPVSDRFFPLNRAQSNGAEKGEHGIARTEVSTMHDHDASSVA